MKIIIELDEKQVRTLTRALELMARIHTGQFNDVYNTLWLNGADVKNPQLARDMLDELKHTVFPDLTGNSFYGIGNEEVAEPAKIAWDIYQAIRYKVAWALNPEGGNIVDFNSVMKTSKVCEIPVVEIKDA